MRSPSLYFLCSLVYVTSHPPFAFKLLNANNYLPPPLPPSFTPHHVLPRELKLLCSSLLLTPHPPSSIYGNWIPDYSCYIWDRGLRFLGVSLKRILSHESGIEGLVCLGYCTKEKWIFMGSTFSTSSLAQIVPCGHRWKIVDSTCQSTMYSFNKFLPWLWWSWVSCRQVLNWSYWCEKEKKTQKNVQID